MIESFADRPVCCVLCGAYPVKRSCELIMDRVVTRSKVGPPFVVLVIDDQVVWNHVICFVFRLLSFDSARGECSEKHGPDRFRRREAASRGYKRVGKTMIYTSLFKVDNSTSKPLNPTNTHTSHCLYHAFQSPHLWYVALPPAWHYRLPRYLPLCSPRTLNKETSSKTSSGPTKMPRRSSVPSMPRSS